MATTLARLIGGPVVFEATSSSAEGDFTADILFAVPLLNTDYEMAVTPKF